MLGTTPTCRQTVRKVKPQGCGINYRHLMMDIVVAFGFADGKCSSGSERDRGNGRRVILYPLIGNGSVCKRYSINKKSIGSALERPEDLLGTEYYDINVM